VELSGAFAGTTTEEPMSERSETVDLVERLRNGDEAAFLEVYRRWQGPLYRFALRMTGSSSLAEDAVQEVFMALIQRIERYDPARGPLGPYLYGMARNHVLRRLERERPYLPLLDGAQGDRRPASEDPQADLLQREREGALAAGIVALPSHYREAIVLCDLQMLSYEDAASALGCAIGTLRSRLHRGRGLLAERLRDREAAPPRQAAFLKPRGAVS
jgi:RNA polymerase sigma-70 factor (ECF subfamily)